MSRNHTAQTQPLTHPNCGDDNPRIYVLLNGNDTPLALYGRDLDGYRIVTDDDV